VVKPQNFGFPFFAVAIIGSQRTVTAAGMATEFLFARLGFAIAGQFAAAAQVWISVIMLPILHKTVRLQPLP
jgi:hypothetical protein